MGDIKTTVYGFPCGGSSFTFKVIEEFLINHLEFISSYHEPEMHPSIRYWWQYKNLQEVKDNLSSPLNIYQTTKEDFNLVKTNYFTRFLDKTSIFENYSIFVIRSPWQWANSALNKKPVRFSPNYFYWHTDINTYLNSNPSKHLIDLWIDICNQILTSTKNVTSKVLYLNYYDYVADYKFLEKTLNNFYQTQDYIKIKDFTEKRLVKTNFRASKGETIKDIPDGFDVSYRLDEIKEIFTQFNFKTDFLNEF